jgi:hypothetical protein
VKKCLGIGCHCGYDDCHIIAGVAGLLANLSGLVEKDSGNGVDNKAEVLEEEQ